MRFPAFEAAMDDPNLRGAALHVYLYISRRLDIWPHREVKVIALAHELRMRQSTVAWALIRLVKLGYLERGPKAVPGDGRTNSRTTTYRLCYSLPPAPCAAIVDDSEPEQTRTA